MDNAANAFELADARNECIKFSGSYLEKIKLRIMQKNSQLIADVERN